MNLGSDIVSLELSPRLVSMNLSMSVDPIHRHLSRTICIVYCVLFIFT